MTNSKMRDALDDEGKPSSRPAGGMQKILIALYLWGAVLYGEVHWTNRPIEGAGLFGHAVGAILSAVTWTLLAIIQSASELMDKKT